MNRFFNALRECFKNGYKKEFYFWLFSLLFYCVGLFLFIKEMKNFITLRENQVKIQEFFIMSQSQISHFKRYFSNINWERDFQKTSTPLNLVISLRDINRAVKDIQNLTSGEESFLLIKEIKYQREKDKEPMLNINAELINFY
ncbi:MAG: hypothetical protein ACK4Y7_05755 [Caldimicrobium sp.]